MRKINDRSKTQRAIKQEWLVQEMYNNEYVFRLDPNQIKKFQKWMKEHKHEPRRGHCAIAVGATFCFTQTSLGEIIKVRCGCGKVIDLTDYDKW
jgi:hypothetical protein